MMSAMKKIRQDDVKESEVGIGKISLDWVIKEGLPEEVTFS